MLLKVSRACQRVATALPAAATLLFLVPGSACSEAENRAELDALELVDVAGYWAVLGRDQEKNHYIRPIVRFRVRNGADAPVDYIQAMAVFKLENLPDEPWGNAFVYSLSEEPLPPGESSDVVVLRSDTNVVSKDAPEQMFHNEKWERVDVEIFLRVGASSWKRLDGFEVPKRIGAPGLEKFLEPEEDPPAAEDARVPSGRKSQVLPSRN